MSIEVGDCSTCKYRNERVNATEQGEDLRFGNACYSLANFMQRLETIRDSDAGDQELVEHVTRELKLAVQKTSGTRVHFGWLGDGLLHPLYCKVVSTVIKEG